MLMARATTHPLDQRRNARQVTLADVQQHEDRLLGQEPEPADRLRVVIVETEVADRRAGLEPLMDPSDDDLLPLGGLALGLRPVAATRLEPLQSTLGHRQVGERELEVELLEVAR